MFHKIIVGADGYSGGPDALCLADTLAADGAELVLAEALPKGETLSPAMLAAYAAALREHAHALLAGRRPALRLHLRVEAVADSAPERALRDLAAAEHADLIIVGSS